MADGETGETNRDKQEGRQAGREGEFGASWLQSKGWHTKTEEFEVCIWVRLRLGWGWGVRNFVGALRRETGNNVCN